ncbi:PEP-CTERM sorting domain-containing protein [Rhizobacter fulvus]|jgi:hypothetical protein
MRLASCVIAVLASASFGVHAQNFVNLGFEEAQLSELEQGGLLTWSQGAPGWSHRAADAYLGYENLNVGYSVSYSLYPVSGCCTAFGTGSYALYMHSGTLYEQIPRGGFVEAEVWQTGTVPIGATTVSVLASESAFSLSLDGTMIDMRPVGGEWRGDVSAFAGRLVELRIGLRTPDERTAVAIDDIRFLPVPEPSTTALLGLGVAVGMAMFRRCADASRHPSADARSATGRRSSAAHDPRASKRPRWPWTRR